eukprot:5539052-Karenia_brevis.AAC.1
MAWTRANGILFSGASCCACGPSVSSSTISSLFFVLPQQAAKNCLMSLALCSETTLPRTYQDHVLAKLR